MSEPFSILIRADAGPRHGFGHVMRCLALAQAAQDAGCPVAWATAECPSAPATRIQTQIGQPTQSISASPGSAADAKETLVLARQLAVKAIILDGYHFDQTYQDIIKKFDGKLLYIDDNGILPNYPSDLVLNQNPYADPAMYPARTDGVGLLLGPQYLLLRHEFRGFQIRHSSETTPSKTRRIIVTFGGCDGANWTARAIAACSLITNFKLEIVAVIGAGNRHQEAIKSAIDNSSYQVETYYDVKNISALMNKADLAITASGTTVWELAALGVPALVIPVADNQRQIAETLDMLGVAQNLGWHEFMTEDKMATALQALLADPARQAAMATAGHSLVDGDGAARVIRELRGNPGEIELRSASLADVTAMWNLANRPEVRNNSFSPELIPFSSHVRWFVAKLANPNCRITVAVRNGQLLGQIRYDRLANGFAAEIDIAVAPTGRGQGLAARLLNETAAQACRALKVPGLLATVFADNQASLQLFRRAGFAETGRSNRAGHEVVTMTWQP